MAETLDKQWMCISIGHKYKEGKYESVCFSIQKAFAHLEKRAD
jgi:hypothetical protein